ncbi:hypothetical protein MAL08_15460 [Leptospira noguchii]|uniref:hypothetical protein n=1 Tax=Leptospira noguchii TaxID=28182 RepID=UPI001FB5A9D1|nr:hypothetical protein [Leptospira noguchii]UOG37424.1 hypothetical protein MAL08_15460 [Leptospira noguchii]
MKKLFLSVLLIVSFVYCGGPQLKDKTPAFDTSSFKVYLLGTGRSDNYSGYRPRSAENDFYIFSLGFENSTDQPVEVDWTLVFLENEKGKFIGVPAAFNEATSFWASFKSDFRRSFGVADKKKETVEPGESVAKEYGFLLQRTETPLYLVLLRDPGDELAKSKDVEKDRKKFILGKVKL